MRLSWWIIGQIFINLSSNCQNSSLGETLGSVYIKGDKYSLGLLNDDSAFAGILKGQGSNEEPLTVNCSKNYSRKVEFISNKNLLKLKIFNERKATGTVEYGWFSEEPKAVTKRVKVYGVSSGTDAVQIMRNLY